MRAFFIDWWWIPGMLMSVLWGFRSGWIWSKTSNHPKWEFFYQFTSNFIGSIADWFCLYAIAVRANSAPDLRALNGMDALLFVGALFGLTGHLIEALVRLMGAIATMAAAAGKKLAG